MGYNIGVRIIEDFLARTGSNKCNDFRDTSEKVKHNIPRKYVTKRKFCSDTFPSSLDTHVVGATSIQDLLERDPHSNKLVVSK